MKIWEGLVAQKSAAWTTIGINKINTPKEGLLRRNLVISRHKEILLKMIYMPMILGSMILIRL